MGAAWFGRCSDEGKRCERERAQHPERSQPELAGKSDCAHHAEGIFAEPAREFAYSTDNSVRNVIKTADMIYDLAGSVVDAVLADRCHYQERLTPK